MATTSKTTGSIVTVGEYTQAKVEDVVYNVLNDSNDLKDSLLDNLPTNTFKAITKANNELIGLFSSISTGSPEIDLDIDGDNKHSIGSQYLALAGETEDKELQAVYARIGAKLVALDSLEETLAKKVATDRDEVTSLLNLNKVEVEKLVQSAPPVLANTDASVSLTRASFDIRLSISRDSIDQSILTSLTKNADEHTLDVIAQKLVADEIPWEQVGTSPSVLERLLFSIQNLVKDKPTKDKPSSVSFKTRGRSQPAFKEPDKAAIRKAVNTRNILKKRILDYERRIEDSESQSPIDLITLLNANIRDAVEGQMGTAADHVSTKYLRSQTGTFSKSARIVNTSTTDDGSVHVTYDYLRKPYSVYTAGHRLFTLQGRDVEHIIESSIQDIATKLMVEKFKITAGAL